MNKFVETLIEKHISKVVYEITIEVCNKDFDEVFAHFKSNKPINDTTIGATFRELEKRSNEVVSLRLGDFLNEITDEMGMVRRTTTNNPFAELAYNLWEGFLDRYDIKGDVETQIGEEYWEKREQLQKAGILDAEGDAI